MKLLSHKRFAASPWGTSLSSKPPSAGLQSPLDIPEILEKILLLLEERTIRNTTRFVCKLWFLVSQRLALREITWDDNRDPSTRLESVLGLLPRAGALSWGVSESKRSWAKLERVLCDMAIQDIQACSRGDTREDLDSRPELLSAIQRQRDPLSVPLRQLQLHGKSNYIEYLDTILPSLSALTSLSLTFVGRFKIDPVLQSCPNLQRLRLEGYNYTNELTEIQLCTRDALPMACLRTLVLRDVYVPILTLERFLKLATATLTELKLIRLITRLGTLAFDTLAETEHTSQLAHFFSHLDTTLLPRLRTLHLSPRISGMSQRHSCQLALIKPGVSKITEWGFCLDDASTYLFPLLQSVGSVVTTLDLVHGITSYNEDLVNMGLNTFLCNAPNLLHLRAPRACIAPLDLSLVRADSLTIDATNIWTCSNLQTLMIGVYHRTDTLFPDREAERGRIVFGYLSRVLPRLKVLELNMSSTNLQLETGFCLLARLQHLEQARVVLKGEVFYWDKKPDLGWMADPRVGRGLRAKWNWQQGRVTARWKQVMEAEVEVVNARRNQLRGLVELGGNTIGLGEDVQWETQGLLTDVKQVLDEIKDGRLRCPWPKLRNFRIYVARSAEKGIEKMIQAVRPGIDMSADYEHVPCF